MFSIIVMICFFSLSMLGFLALTHGTHTMIGCIANKNLDCPVAIMTSAIHHIEFLRSFSLGIVILIFLFGIFIYFGKIFLDITRESGDDFTTSQFDTQSLRDEIISWLARHINSPTALVV